jgi:hypothetical protein
MSRGGEKERLKSCAHGKTKDYLPFEVAAANVGGLIMFFTQGEPFNEYQSGLRKEFAGTPLMFIAYTQMVRIHICLVLMLIRLKRMIMKKTRCMFTFTPRIRCLPK